MKSSKQTSSNQRRGSQLAKSIRWARKTHRSSAIVLFSFFLLVSTTGLLLGWKKHSGGRIQAKSQQGSSSNLSEWLPLDSLYKNACQFVHDSISPDLSLELDRIDIRQEKGMLKFIFKNHFWAVQMDGSTGELLLIERRNSDIIEKIHDGSILDFYVKTQYVELKLIYTSIMGLSLLLFSATGFWLWYGPRILRQKRSLK